MGGRNRRDDLEREVILLINLLTAAWESFIWRNKNKYVAGRYSLGTVWGMKWILKIISFPTLIFVLRKGSFHLFMYRSNTHLAGGFWITRVYCCCLRAKENYKQDRNILWRRNTNSEQRLNELQNRFFQMEKIWVQVFRSATWYLYNIKVPEV